MNIQTNNECNLDIYDIKTKIKMKLYKLVFLSLIFPE